jgi:hypothetical protein
MCILCHANVFIESVPKNDRKGKHTNTQSYAHEMGSGAMIYIKTKLRGFSPQANYTDRATAACRRS